MHPEGTTGREYDAVSTEVESAETSPEPAPESVPPPVRSRWKRIAATGVILICLGILFIAAFPASVYFYANHDGTRKADAAIVLGAAVYDDTPSPVFLERIQHGVNLYQKGLVKKLIFTGGRDPFDKMSESQVARDKALELGVPAEDVLVEERSRTTWENLKYAAPLAAEHRLGTVLIVSDPIHMRRAISMARHQGYTAYSSPTPTSMYRSRKARHEFILSEAKLYAAYWARRMVGLEAGSR